jgi:hypothetical protein
MEQRKTCRHVLFVTGPLRERLFRRFSALFDGRDDVEVRLDRRVAERRQVGNDARAGERRVRERRRHSPGWMVPPSGI